MEYLSEQVKYYNSISLSVTGRHGHVIQFWSVSYKVAHGQVFLQRKGCIFLCMVVGDRM